MIGVFDSGHGGLTILRALVQHLPNRSFLYFGDHAHMPYGERSSAEIVDLTRSAVETLFAHGCRLVVLACNTAAAVALRTLQQGWLAERYPDRRILGVLVPTVEAVTGVAWLADVAPREEIKRTIAIFATRRTVASNAYVEEIGKRAPGITVVQQACPHLVNMIERGASRDELRDAIQGFVGELTQQLAGARPDAVMLGCTHYPLVADLFAEALPEGLEILSQPQLVARGMGDYLGRHPEIDMLDPEPRLQFLTTGDTANASSFATTFFGKPATFQTVV
jgi:glutamate racemase